LGKGICLQLLWSIAVSVFGLYYFFVIVLKA